MRNGYPSVTEATRDITYKYNATNKHIIIYIYTLLHYIHMYAYISLD